MSKDAHFFALLRQHPVLSKLLPIFFSLIIFLFLLQAVLPWLLHHVVTPALGQALQTPVSIEIRRADFSGLDLGPIRVGEQGDLCLEAVHIDWSLTGLIQGQVDQIRLLGLTLVLREENGWVLPGFATSQKSDSAKKTLFLPRIKNIHLDGTLTLKGQSLNTQIPFAAHGSLQDHLLLHSEARLAGQPLSITLQSESGFTDFRLLCALPQASMTALGTLLPDLPPLSGQIQAQAEAFLPSNQPPHVTGALNFTALQTPWFAQTGTSRFTWQDGLRLNLNLTPVTLQAPLPLVLNIDDIQADLPAQKIRCAWEMRIPALPKLPFDTPLRLNGESFLQGTKTGFLIQTQARQHPFAIHGDTTKDSVMRLGESHLDLTLITDPRETNLNAQLTLGDLDMADGRLSGLKLTASAAIAQGKTKGVLKANAAIHLEEISGDMGLHLPLSWPEATREKGTLRLDLDWKKTRLLRLAAGLTQKKHGLDVKGMTNIFPANIQAVVDGQVTLHDLENSWLNVSSQQTVLLPGNLPKLVPDLVGLSGSAQLDAKARLTLRHGAPKIPLRLELSNINLTQTDSKAAIHGGHLNLASADLLLGRSEPDQRLGFTRLELGALILENGDVHFQLEKPNILVEGCTFAWAGGRIGTHAFRINPGVENYTVVLYCDQVRLSDALEQLGLSDVSGGGTANGRIPVHYEHASLRFDQGFLYSTPGEKGVLRMRNTEMLTAGVPTGTVQHGQMDLAAEALKNFAYDWAKIRMNTEGQELVIALELDGKPAKALPFTFNQNLGGFVRITDDSTPPVFQGIRLDVNFRLPLDQLLEYRQLLELMQ